MQKNNYAPLIEFHGYTNPEFMRLKDQLSEAMKKVLLEKDYENLTFSLTASKVVCVNNQNRPFLRLYSSEFDIVHKVHEILLKLKWETEIEFIKITNYYDLRKK